MLETVSYQNARAAKTALVVYLYSGGFVLNATDQHAVSRADVDACCYIVVFELGRVTVLPGLAALLGTHVPVSSCCLALPPPSYW